MARSKATSTRVEILGGAYQSRAIITSAQRAINLYPESNEADPQAPTKVTHFPTPGSVLVGTPTVAGIARCTYTASNNKLFEVVGANVYYVDDVFTYHFIGAIPDGTTPVKMADNGFAIVIVGGSTWGYAIKMSDHSFAAINDPYFLGGTFVWYLDTYFVLNTPGTPSFQISLTLVTFENLTAGAITPPNIYAAFDPLDVAQKTGYPDSIASIIVNHLSIWLIGDQCSTENWYNSGAADFTFARISGVYTHFGTIAPYSIATQDLSVFWVAQDLYGKCIILEGTADFSVKRVSPYGLEAIMQRMTVVSDAIGMCYQINGHPFYVLQFPTENRTFFMDMSSHQWSEWAFTTQNGLTRHPSNCMAFAYGRVLFGHYQNGNLYQLDSDIFDDAGSPIVRLRTIPHLIADGKRWSLKWVMVDLQGGTLTSATPQNPPEVTLRVSTDRGATFVDAGLRSMGAAGEYETMPTFESPASEGRDIVLEVSWSAPIDTALNGIWYDAEVVTGDDI